MKLLAIETATESCSVALSHDGALLQRSALLPRGHAQAILPMIDASLAEAGLGLSQLDALAFGCGPGSFTGLRIASAVIQGLALGMDRPVVPVSTLAALAQGAYRESGQPRVLAALDARMQEVYWGAYRADEQGLMQLQGAEVVCRPEEVAVPTDGGWYGAGSGWGASAAALASRLKTLVVARRADLYPQARDIVPLAIAAYQRGVRLSASHAQPVYLRDEVAHKK